MTRDLFYKLYHDAQDQPDLELYINEYGYPDYFNEISEDPDKVVAALTDIHRVAHMSLRDLISASGMTQNAYARYFDIPLRTIENWATGKRSCPEYVKLMMSEILGLIKS